MKHFAYMDEVISETPRLDVGRMKNEPSVRLAKYILQDIRRESEKIVQAPFKRGVESMIELFSSDFYNGISMGHSDVAVKDFISRLPKEALQFVNI